MDKIKWLKYTKILFLISVIPANVVIVAGLYGKWYFSIFGCVMLVISLYLAIKTDKIIKKLKPEY